MAVFTSLTQDDIETLLKRYSIGTMIKLEPISSGIENTNYFLTTTQGQWVLTLFEKLKADELDYFLALPEHLAKEGCQVACPARQNNGALLAHCAGKPATIANRLEGRYCPIMPVAACADMGKLLAKMHLASASFPLKQRNLRDLQWIDEASSRIKPYLPEALFSHWYAEVEHQKNVQSSEAWHSLGRYATHCDLFRDNALIANADTPQACVSGVFDFYFAGDMPWLYDLAVTINDWCIDCSTGAFIEEKAQAFIESYHRVRPLSNTEKSLWRDTLRLAALRFWTSRLDDFYRPREASLLKPHDPTHFERILLLRQNEALPWPTL